MKILLAVDGSPYTRRMLAYLAAHKELISPAGEFTALTVVTPVPSHVSSFIEGGTLKGYYAEQAEAVLKPVREFAQQNQWKPQFSTAVGQPAEAIAKAAEEGKFDLVVMGSHGHTPLASLVMGSVASRVLAHCQTPVLIIR
jgi:nucleotide-binding universal stress UspA family protein